MLVVISAPTDGIYEKWF